MISGKTLLASVALSVAIHGLALVAAGGAPTSPVAGQQLRVSLLSGPAQVSVTASSAASGGGRHNSGEATTQSLVNPGSTNQPGQGGANNSSHSNSQTLVTAATAPASGKRITTELKKILAANFTYPPIALARGHEGRVIVQVDIEPDGRISDAKLHQSSGFNTLDLAAIDSVRGIRQAPQLQQWLQGNRISINVPVVYRLIEA